MKGQPMLEKLSTRWIVIVAVLIFGIVWISPNFIKYDPKGYFGKAKMVLGLDIQGGLHLVMGVDVKEVVKEQLAREVKNLQAQMKDTGVKFQSVAVTGADSMNIQIMTGGAENKDAITKFIDDRYGSTLQVVNAAPETIELRYFDAKMIEMEKHVVEQAIEVIRNRIDEFGVSEPNISAEGTDRILVQLPGIQDAARAKELINRTARLDFRVVSSELAPDKLQSLIDDAEKKGNFKLGENKLTYLGYVKKLNEDLAGQLPKDSRIVFEKMENAQSLEAGRRPYLIKTDSLLNGGQLEDASVRPDEYGKPEVVFRFSVEGRKLFADITSKAAGGSIAIVLDDVVKSAPHVEREIDSDTARITLGASRDYNATLNEATFIATALRAGALPAALEPMEERAVGPSLGSDSINKAKNASLISALAVFLFMFIYYRTAGLIADLSLIVNIFLTFAVLTSMGATLTLPGIAGIALTIGMAVDANVIIYERIREERRKGATMAGAVRDGYANAFASIFDANLTTILTCLVLMYYGNGPIRGFAVSLTIGIVTSMFTAIFFSRTVLDTMVTKFNIEILSSGIKGAKS
jgi:preprotein translocase subunit SecD